MNGYDLVATEEEKYNFIMSIADGSIIYEGIINWLKNHLKELK
jgi:prophage maintenance system killer protein